MIELITGLPDNVVAIDAKGKVTADDYETVLIPALENALKLHSKVRMLYQMGREFTSITPGAMFDDAKMGMKHLTAFEKIAFVTDVEWMVNAVKVFSVMIPCPVHIYGNDRLAEAKDWLLK